MRGKRPVFFDFGAGKVLGESFVLFALQRNLCSSTFHFFDGCILAGGKGGYLRCDVCHLLVEG
jgi:hypothetical protein